jgi:hypothetical protein
MSGTLIDTYMEKSTFYIVSFKLRFSRKGHKVEEGIPVIKIDLKLLIF